MAKKNEISIQEILEKKKLAENERSNINLIERLEDYRRIIEAELDPKFVNYKKKYSRSCLDDPFLLSLVEFLVAEETIGIFGTEPFIGVEGFEDDDIKGAKNMTNLLRQQFYADSTQYTIICWLIATQAYPSGVVKVGWDFQAGGPKIELTPLETIYFSPASTGPLNKMIPWIIHESWQHIDDLEAAVAEDNTPLYSNLKELKEDMSKRDEKTTATGNKYDKYTPQERKGMVHILDFWKDDFNLAIANEKIKIIEDRPNPYEHNRKPFIVMCDFPRLMSPYGISTIQKCYDTYRELITRKNQRIDNVSQAINSGWYINEQASVDEDALVEWDVGRVVRGNGPFGEAMARLAPDAGNTALAYREVEECRRGMQDATHAYAYARGETPIRKETATGLQQLVAASSLVFRFKIMMKENQAIKELAAMVGALNQQYLPDKTIIRILGESVNDEAKRETISRDDIKGRFDYIAKGSAIDPEIGKPMKRSHMLQMYQQLMPAVQMGGLSPEFLLDYTLLLMEQLEIPEATALAKRYKRQIEQQKKAQQMQAQAMQQQVGGRQLPKGMGATPTPMQGGPEMGSPQVAMKQEAGRSMTP